jgi:hydroxyacylglutathione hydrolase
LEIVPGIHEIDGVPIVNCYLIISGKSLILVDTGMPGNFNRVVNYIKKLGKSPSDLKYILLTHSDVDHIGCALKLKEFTGAKVAIHAAEVPVLKGKQKFKTVNNWLGPLVGWFMGRAHYRPLEPDIVLNSSSQIEDWQVISTPGHTPGSVCFYQPGRNIFAGDALRTNSKGVPRPISSRICLDPALAKKSLRIIAGLDFETLLPGHGSPVVGQASSRVREMVNRVSS